MAGPAGAAWASPPRDLWLVSARGAAHQAGAGLQYWRYDGGWQPAAHEEFISAEAELPVLIYVHGNRVGSGEAFHQARAIARSLDSVAFPSQAYRLVMFSWPSAGKQLRVRQEMQHKAWQSERVGLHLAWLVDQLDPHTPVRLFGFSFGARTICAALHVLGGGQVSGQRLAPRHPARDPVRVILQAAAMNGTWLAPGSRYGNALAQVEQMLVLVNSADRALRFYPLMYRGSRPQALGYAGISPKCLGPYADRLRQRHVECVVGSQHEWCPYVSPTVLQRYHGLLLNERISVAGGRRTVAQ